MGGTGLEPVTPSLSSWCSYADLQGFSPLWGRIWGSLTSGRADSSGLEQTLRRSRRARRRRSRSSACTSVPSRTSTDRSSGRPRNRLASPRELGGVMRAGPGRLGIESLVVAPGEVVVEPDRRDAPHRDAVARKAEELRLEAAAILVVRTVRPVLRQARPALDRLVVILGREPGEARGDSSPAGATFRALSHLAERPAFRAASAAASFSRIQASISSRCRS